MPLQLKDIRRRGRYALARILEPSDREFFGAAQKQYEGAVESVGEGYQLARRNISEAYRGAAREQVEGGRQATAAALSRLQSSGFSGSSSIRSNSASVARRPVTASSSERRWPV